MPVARERLPARIGAEREPERQAPEEGLLAQELGHAVAGALRGLRLHAGAVGGVAPGEPAAAIAADSVHEPDEEGETEYGIHPLFVSVTPAMRLTDHDGTEA